MKKHIEVSRKEEALPAGRQGGRRHTALVALLFVSLLLPASPSLLSLRSLNAQTTAVPQVNINQTPTNGPFGGFRLVVCDGPSYASLKAPISIDWNGKTYTVPPNPQGYIPCDFRGLMIQAQFLINTMLVLGVLAAIIGFTYAGFKYIATPIADKKSEAAAMFPKIFWGFIIMLTAWFIVRQILIWLTGNSAYLQ